jgi:hypothetical protein
MTRALRELAQRHAYVKFGEIEAQTLSQKFSTDAGLPALLIYRNGVCVRAFRSVY